MRRSSGTSTGFLFSSKTPADLGGDRWVFDHPFFIVLNLVVGGQWPGSPNTSTPTNLSKGKPTTSSSNQNSSTTAARATDGITTTRWSSAASDPQWLRVDLGSTRTINKIVLNWERAYGTAFQIQTSNDGTAWTDIYSTTTGTGGVQTPNVTGSGR